MGSSVQFYESFEIENPVVIPFHLVEMIRNQRTESISIFTNYGDPHRIFVQSMLSRGIITYNDFTTLFEAIFRKCNVPLRSKLGTEKQKIFIKTVNEKLEKKCNLKLFVGVDEESPKKNTYLVLVNRTDRSKDSNKLTIVDQVVFEPHEMEYLKLILNEIMDDPLRQIKSIRALNIAKNRIQTTEGSVIETQEAEAILQKFKDRKWLTENKGIILLSTRFIMEMEPYIKDTYSDRVGECDLCKKIVIRSVECPNEECDSQVHACCAEEIKHKCLRCKSTLPKVRQDNSYRQNISVSGIPESSQFGMQRFGKIPRLQTALQDSDSE